MLNKLTIKSRLLLLILISMIGATIMGSMYIGKIYQEYSDAVLLKKYISHMPTLSNVIHSLQKERGASYGYLYAEKELDFEKILNEEISNTNKHLLVMQGIKKKVVLSNFSQNANAIINEIPALINELSIIREAIKTKNIIRDDVMVFYEKLISHYIRIIEELVWFNVSVEVNDSIMSYNYFMLWKENIGQERAMGSSGFNVKDFDVTRHHQYLLNMSEINTFKELFMAKATNEEHSLGYAALNSPIKKEITEIRNFIIQNKLEEVQKIVTGLQWYNLLSAKINLMNDVEQKLITRLLLKTNQIELHHKSRLINFTTLTIILLLTAILLSIRIANSISLPIRNIGKVMSELKTSRKMSKAVNNIPHINEQTEIGQLSRQFNTMLRTIHKQNENLEKERDKAEAANYVKSDFLANMSHEFRTPLNAIIGFTEVLSLNKDKTIRENANYLGYIHDSGEHLLLLVDNVLNAANISTGITNIKEDVFSLQKFINNCFSTLQELTGKNNILLVCNLKNDKLNVKADNKRLHQVFINILSNAIKFSPEDEKIFVDVNIAANNDLNIVIKDNGIGMNKHEQRKAFQVFGQSEEGYSRLYDGIGLGLPLARGIVKLHGGTLTLESAPGKGTRVLINLPKERVVL